jgi:hypothetical protein
MGNPLPHIYLILLVGLWSGTTNAQILQDSHIAYVYPGGGQIGTSFEVTVGGKGLAKVEDIQISGSGVTATFIEHITNYKRKMQEQLRFVKKQKSGNQRQPEKIKERKFGPPPEHEMFTRLEELSAAEFRQVAIKFQTKEKVQRNRELDELVILRIDIAPGARPGMRELRLLTRVGGASNPLRFMVNTLPEAREYEPNDLKSPKESHMRIPFIMNGQIMPGDEDRFSFDAIEGQKLVLRVMARELVPYLADAVPGWFQAVVAVHDNKGKEVAYADDYLFNPDPALLFEVPENGRYHVSIRDSIYRGREDFVYRVAVGEIPFVTGIFPLGAQLGSQVTVTARGWNLGAAGFELDTAEGSAPVKRGYLHTDETISNYVRYAVGDRPESVEDDNNDTMKTAHRADLEATINGRIDKVGDVDFYRFRAGKGQTVKVSVAARRLYSPVDSLVRVFDKDGNVLTWNDDMPAAGNLTDRTGLITHNSDSELVFTAPAKGTYFIQVTDTQNKGGPAYAYRLSLYEPVPGFELYVTPSAITVPGGAGGKARLHVKRINGFDGPIDIKLSNPSSGLDLSGGRIPVGSDSVPVVISPQRNFGSGLVPLNLVASAEINGETVSRRIIPADEITQAFITHHLVEANHLEAYVPRKFRKQPSVRLKDTQGIVLSAGESVRLDLRTGNFPDNAGEPICELEDAPEGISLETEHDLGRTSLIISADESLESKLEGNLVVGVSFEITSKSRKGDSKTRKISLGVLPAIPYRTQ